MFALDDKKGFDKKTIILLFDKMIGGEGHGPENLGPSKQMTLRFYKCIQFKTIRSNCFIAP